MNCDVATGKAMREAFGVRPACRRFSTCEKREQARRTPNADAHLSPSLKSRLRLSLLFVLLTAPALLGTDIQWTQLSSKNGDLPLPGESAQQTGAITADLDKDGVDDFVLSFRQKPPALVWYRRTGKGWDRYVIEKDFLTVEAGGAVYDIDGDGDADLVFGGDWQSKEVWWWENPYPKFDPKTAWKRHVIKKDGATQHHDQAFGDFKGMGK